MLVMEMATLTLNDTTLTDDTDKLLKMMINLANLLLLALPQAPNGVRAFNFSCRRFSSLPA